MITNWFGRERPNQQPSQHIEEAPHAKKMKRTTLRGFFKKETPTRIKNMENASQLVIG